MSSQPIKIYADLLSEPSRTVIIFCRLHEIPYEFVAVDLKKGEHKSTEFKQINPNGAVPAMTHGDFKLYESFAIIGYLAQVFNIDSQWWPTDPQRSALVHCYLHWHHEHIRKGGNLAFFATVMPKLLKREPPPGVVEESRIALESSLKLIEEILASGKYVARTDSPTIADIACFSQLQAMRMMAYDFSEYPSVVNWSQEISQVPFVQEAHQTIEEFITMLSSLE